MRNFFRKRRGEAGLGQGDAAAAEAASSRGTAAAAIAAARLAGPSVPPKLRPVSTSGPRDARVPEGRAQDGGVQSGRPVAALAAAPPAAGRAPQGGAPDGDEATDLPRFAFPATSKLKPQRSGGGEAALLTGLTPEVNGVLREAFTPTRPKKQLNALFVGRNATLKRIISAVEEERAHVILFGDRGRGKTSLSNAVEHIAAQAGYLAIKITCSGELSFEDIFRHALKRIPAAYYRSGSDSPFASRRTFTSFAELLPEGPVSVTQLNDVLENIQNTHVLLILDEYDRVTDEDFRNKLAELFKNLTDSAIPMTLMVVGVAENLDQLLGKHPSIQRSLVPVHLPLMSDTEIERLIQAGAENAGLTFQPDTARRVAGFARGLPYYAQLLGLHAARSAFSRGEREVEVRDLAYAVNRCLQEAERGIVEAYNRCLAGARREELEDALHAAALCPADEYGAFDPADIAGAGPVETDDASARARLDERLERMTQEDHGSLLVAVPEPGRTRYRFRNQMCRQYILMRLAVERGQI